MTCTPGVNLYSEIGQLKRVILHRPGRELENLSPHNMERLLFDDIPEMNLAAKEHDNFAQTLRDCGAEVLYLESLLADLLSDMKLRREFLQEFLQEARVYSKIQPHLLEYLLSLETDELTGLVFAGLRREDFSLKSRHISDMDNSDLLWFDPIPNTFFMRDAMTMIANGVAVNCMWSETRRREAMLMDFIYRHHPLFAGARLFYERDSNAFVEGGDVLVLSDELIMIGVSQRTEALAAETLAYNVLSDPDNSISHALLVMIPRKRAFMHLDTVFTMVDRDLFILHDEISHSHEVYDISLDASGESRIRRQDEDLDKVLAKFLHLPEVGIIRCGGESMIDAQREQWSDGANTLAVAPGEVVVYERNRISNNLLREAGVRVHEISSSELSRGRGGPRCMSMPLWRENL